MTSPLLLALAMAWGGLGGLAFFGLLRTSVANLPGARRPVLHIVSGMLLRFVVALAVFAVVARYGGWQHLLAAAAGFTLARAAMTRRVAINPGDGEARR